MTTKLKGVVMTSSPSPISRARTREVETCRPARAGDPLTAPESAAIPRLELPRERTHGQHVALQDLGHQFELARSDIGPGERDLRRTGRGGVGHLVSEGWQAGCPRCRGRCRVSDKTGFSAASHASSGPDGLGCRETGCPGRKDGVQWIDRVPSRRRKRSRASSRASLGSLPGRDLRPDEAVA